MKYLIIIFFVFQVSAQQKVVFTENAPKPLAAYSQAVKAHHMVFTAGQIGLDPATRTLVSGGTIAEFQQIIKNLDAVLKASGSSFSKVVSVNIYLKNLSDFARLNDEYIKIFPTTPPARTTVGVADLPCGASIEISMIALYE